MKIHCRIDVCRVRWGNSISFL